MVIESPNNRLIESLMNEPSNTRFGLSLREVGVSGVQKQRHHFVPTSDKQTHLSSVIT